LPFIPETDPRIASILTDAVVAVECENSLWRGAKMPDFLTPLRPQKRLGGKPGLRKGAVLPNIIIKEEDRQPLDGMAKPSWRSHSCLARFLRSCLRTFI
jgi:hypothetical protein